MSTNPPGIRGFRHAAGIDGNTCEGVSKQNRKSKYFGVLEYSTVGEVAEQNRNVKIEVQAKNNGEHNLQAGHNWAQMQTI